MAEDACDSDVSVMVSHTDDPAVYQAQSDGVALQIDTVAINGVPGTTTYRLYAVLTNPDDCLSAVVGEGADATWVTSTAPFYQHELGGVTPSSIDPILFGLYPDLEYDSWVTIGIDRVPNSSLEEGVVQVVESSPWTGTFNDGGSLALNSAFGDGWFAFTTSANCRPNDEGRVLLAQLSTSGHLRLPSLLSR